MPLPAYLRDVFIQDVWTVCISYKSIPRDPEGWMCGSDRSLENAYQSWKRAQWPDSSGEESEVQEETMSCPGSHSQT